MGKLKKIFFFGLSIVFITSIFDSTAHAQKKKPRAKKAVTKKPAAPPLNLPKVIQIDQAALSNLLKREGENAKPLLINFWATWCDPCREEFPELVKIDEEYKGKIDFITISLDDLAEMNRGVPKFLASMKATMPAYLLKTPDEEAAIISVAKDWQGGLPFTILFDSKGKQAYFRQGKVTQEGLKKELEKLINVSASTSKEQEQQISTSVSKPAFTGLPVAQREPVKMLETQPITDLPLLLTNKGAKEGESEAKTDISNGILRIKRYGLTPGFSIEYINELKKKYGIEIFENGCMLVRTTPEYFSAYNKTMVQEIKKKFGEKVLKQLPL